MNIWLGIMIWVVSGSIVIAGIAWTHREEGITVDDIPGFICCLLLGPVGLFLGICGLVISVFEHNRHRVLFRSRKRIKVLNSKETKPGPYQEGQWNCNDDH